MCKMIHYGVLSLEHGLHVRLDVSIEENVPEPGADAEAQRSVLVVVLHVEHLQLAPVPLHRVAEVQEVMHDVVNDIASEGASCEHACEFYAEQEVGRREEHASEQGHSQGGREHKSIFILREGMVNSVSEEVDSVDFSIAREDAEVFDVENKPVDEVLGERPVNEAECEQAGLLLGGEVFGHGVEEVHDDGDPEQGNEPPGGHGHNFQK
mmetsp:Transcript_19819/g.30550  ORF Transcript_19819/g.30550 Transcript_19819/m.30550 type:complete len:209 (-) Transcript_19819:517-1143(-)